MNRLTKIEKAIAEDLLEQKEKRIVELEEENEKLKEATTNDMLDAKCFGLEGVVFEQRELIDKLRNKTTKLTDKLKSLLKKFCEEIREMANNYCCDDIFLLDKFLEDLAEIQAKYEKEIVIDIK